MDLTFTMTESESNLVLNALAELSFRVSSPLIKKLQDQASPQIDEFNKSKTVDNFSIGENSEGQPVNAAGQVVEPMNPVEPVVE